MSAQVIFTNTLPTPTTTEVNPHKPDKFTDKKRNELKAAFRLAINKSKTREEARRLNKMRQRFFSPGGLTADEAIEAWLEVTLMCKAPRTPTTGNGNGRFHVSAG